MPDSSNTSTAIDLLSKASEVVSEEITSETKEIAPYTRYSDLKMFLFSKSQIQQSWLLRWLNCASAIDIWFTYFIFDHLSIVSQVINENTWFINELWQQNLKKISHLFLKLLSNFKSKWEIFQMFLAFSEYLNFEKMVDRKFKKFDLLTC